MFPPAFRKILLRCDRPTSIIHSSDHRATDPSSRGTCYYVPIHSWHVPIRSVKPFHFGICWLPHARILDTSEALCCVVQGRRLPRGMTGPAQIVEFRWFPVRAPPRLDSGLWGSSPETWPRLNQNVNFWWWQVWAATGLGSGSWGSFRETWPRLDQIVDSQCVWFLTPMRYLCGAHDRHTVTLSLVWMGCESLSLHSALKFWIPTRSVQHPSQILLNLVWSYTFQYALWTLSANPCALKVCVPIRSVPLSRWIAAIMACIYTFLYVPCNPLSKLTQPCPETIRSYMFRATLSLFCKSAIPTRSSYVPIRSAYLFKNCVPPKVTRSYMFRATVL